MRSLLSLTAALAGLTACANAQTLDVSLDSRVAFDASLEAMTPVFDRVCAHYRVRELSIEDLPIAQNSHIQVDCNGFQHAGQAREAEFVFADDQLAFVWVLTDAAEEPGLLAQMHSTYGTPTHDTPMFVAFADDLTALRRDTPEFLFYSARIAPMYRGWFDQMAAG